MLPSGDDSVRRPFHGQAIRNAREHPIAGGIAPEDQVGGGDLRLRDCAVVAYLRVAAELASPFVDGVLLLGGDPAAGGWRDRSTGRRDENEAAEECVLHRSLESMAPVQARP